MDRLGTLKHSSIWKIVSCSDPLCNGIFSGILFCTATVWSDALWDETGPCNNSDKLRARCDCERQTTGNQENDILADPFRCPTRNSNLKSSSVKSGTLSIVVEDPCFQSILPSHSLSLPWLQRPTNLAWVAGAKKKQFSGSKKLFYPHCCYETQTSPALKKKTWSKNMFFFLQCSYETHASPALQKKHQGLNQCFFLRCCYETQTSPTLKKQQALKTCLFVCLLSNLPTSPRYLALARSKLRRCIRYITKNALRI